MIKRIKRKLNCIAWGEVVFISVCAAMFIYPILDAINSKGAL